MFELLIRKHLFNAEAKTHWTEEDDHLAQMLEITEEIQFSEDMRHREKRSAEFFDDDGTKLTEPC